MSARVAAKFYELVMEARDASVEVDNFDLHEDERSRRIWKDLLATQLQTSTALIYFVNTNAAMLLAAIQSLE